MFVVDGRCDRSVVFVYRNVEKCKGRVGKESVGEFESKLGRVEKRAEGI